MRKTIKEKNRANGFYIGGQVSVNTLFCKSKRPKNNVAKIYKNESKVSLRSKDLHLYDRYQEKNIFLALKSGDKDSFGTIFASFDLAGVSVF